VYINIKYNTKSQIIFLNVGLLLDLLLFICKHFNTQDQHFNTQDQDIFFSEMNERFNIMEYFKI